MITMIIMMTTTTMMMNYEENMNFARLNKSCMLEFLKTLRSKE